MILHVLLLSRVMGLQWSCYFFQISIFYSELSTKKSLFCYGLTKYKTTTDKCCILIIPPLPEGRGGYTVLPLSVCPSILPSIAFDIWLQASYRYPISWKTFLDLSDSYFLFADLLIFIHIEHICPFFVAFFSATIDGRNLIFGHKLHIGTPYREKCFLTCQIPTSCFPKSGGIISELLLTVHLVGPIKKNLI